MEDKVKFLPSSHKNINFCDKTISIFPQNSVPRELNIDKNSITGGLRLLEKWLIPFWKGMDVGFLIILKFLKKSEFWGPGDEFPYLGILTKNH